MQKMMVVKDIVSHGCMQGCFDACLDERRVFEMLPAAPTFSGQPFSSLGAARCLNPELEAPCQAPQPRSALVLSVKLTFHLQGNLQYLECSARIHLLSPRDQSSQKQSLEAKKSLTRR